MKGKIFKDSENVYQDQARILLDFYEKAAEKIVFEEKQIERRKSELEEELATLNKDISRTSLLKWLLFIFIIPFILYFIKEGNLKKSRSILEEQIEELNKKNREIFRGYKVSKMAIAYVPVANQVKYENKSFIVDYTGTTKESEFKLQIPKHNETLVEKIEELEQLSKEAPMVESSFNTESVNTQEFSSSMQELNQNDYFGALERALRTITYCIDDIDTTSVSLPLVSNNSDYHNFLREYSTNDIPAGAPVFEVFDTSRYYSQISKFHELNRMKDTLSRHTSKFEDVLKGLMLTLAQSVQTISSLKIASADKIVFESNRVLFKILKSPYNHYSPVLEQAEIERIRNESFNYGESIQEYVPFQLKSSSKVRYNILSDNWVAEDGSTTNMPFGIHQIHEEIVAPIVQSLMEETRVERLKIYNHIKDQKISYLNKWHQDTEDFYGRNRAESADLVNLMRNTLSEYVAAYNTMISMQKTEESMKQSKGSLDSSLVESVGSSVEILAAFEKQSQEFQSVQTDFENYMEQLKEDIVKKADSFEHIDYYEALLRDGNSKETAVAAKEIYDMDERRRPLIAVNPLFAKMSEMPPEPSVDNITFELVSMNLPDMARDAIAELEHELQDEL
ncbi:MAG: hypothetical protein CVU13_08925 [Bacteroidetes bacterium HGW-Bacteroidetes-8]|jgi:hypothetical protein|nr:MAG: hypothetical protein CVU13_08925 [Bacteroidetes bacterium HGW-Bacteroidetes-8]